jgi:hypothetical protein
MQHILTEEELKNLSGNRDLIKKEYEEKLKVAIDNFGKRLSNLLVAQGGRDPFTHYGPTKDFLDLIRQAMKESKLE